MSNILLTFLFFASCFALLGIGFLLRGTVLHSSCGGASKLLGGKSECACSKKEAEICPSDDKSGLLHLSQIANPHRTIKEHDDHEEQGFQV